MVSALRPTKKLPLFWVTGASCVGKSTACGELFAKETDYIVIESDILWNTFYDTPQDDYKQYRTVWLNLCAAISQIGLPCVICGCCTPKQLEYLRERDLFTQIHYLAVVCEEEVLRHRMTEGRKVTDPSWIDSSMQFNRWLKAHAEETSPRIELLDNSNLTPQETASSIDAWIRRKLAEEYGA